MKRKASLLWFRHPRPGLHYAHHDGRVILLHGFPKATAFAREFEVYDGKTRVGLIRGLDAAKAYAEKHIADREG